MLGLVAPHIAPSTEKLARALKDGTTGVLNVAATCATAGIIVGVVTLTGLAQRFADIIIGYAQGSLLLTAMFTAAIVWIVGLAVPVTASYIMCAVIAAPALIKLGVPDFAAHMFIFYYAVLSEVSPPTALSPFAAAAITGGSPYLTTLQSWKYTMPAFLVPFVFVLDPQGIGLLLKVPPGGTWFDIVEIFLESAAGIAMLAFAAQGWFLKKNTVLRDGAVRHRRLVPRVPGRPLTDHRVVDRVVDRRLRAAVVGFRPADWRQRGARRDGRGRGRAYAAHAASVMSHAQGIFGGAENALMSVCWVPAGTGKAACSLVREWT